jgi:catechol-2,3-dioxygenase
VQRKFDPKVFQLGFVALATADIERTKDHYLEAIGMTETATGDGGSVFLSIGYDHHNIVLRPADGKSLLHVGFQLKAGIALAEFAQEARAAGLAAIIKTDSQPGVLELVEVEGPGGNVFQFYGAIATPAPGFKRTGVAPLRLGHLAVISPEGEKLLKFYQEFLGFWYTDDIQGIATFLTCNRDHHVVNVVSPRSPGFITSPSSSRTPPVMRWRRTAFVQLGSISSGAPRGTRRATTLPVTTMIPTR